MSKAIFCKFIPMERTQRVNQLIKKELGQIFLRELDFPKNVLVTITRVETSSNLIHSKIYISVLPEDGATQVLQILNGQIYEIQQFLNKRLRMRPIPKINFVEEKVTREAGRIEELLEEIKRK